MAKLFACYLVDVRNDGTSTKDSFEFHRQVVKIDRPVAELVQLGKKLLTRHPNCDRITVMGSGVKRGAVWLYDSAGKIRVRKFG